MGLTSTITAHRTKLDSRASPNMFLGYKPNTKGYFMFNMVHHIRYVSRNVIFH